MTFSISALLMPMALIGYTSSVLRQTTRFTASPRGQFSVPSTLVRTAHRMKLAGRNLLQRCRMKDKVHATHGGLNAPRIPNIADIELQFRVVAAFPHVILLLSSRLKIRSQRYR
jgi:hypothetical protein